MVTVYNANNDHSRAFLIFSPSWWFNLSSNKILVYLKDSISA